MIVYKVYSRKFRGKIKFKLPAANIVRSLPKWCREDVLFVCLCCVISDEALCTSGLLDVPVARSPHPFLILWVHAGRRIEEDWLVVGA